MNKQSAAKVAFDLGAVFVVIEDRDVFEQIPATEIRHEYEGGTFYARETKTEHGVSILFQHYAEGVAV